MNDKPKIFSGRGRIITEILGRNKYTNYKQALNESIANSLDAKSTFIEVLIDKTSISIIDNGIGMSENDLINRYFKLGEKNKDPKARGAFGIGVCANSALGDKLIVETRIKGENDGIRTVVDFNKVEAVDIGNYVPEVWEKVRLFDNKYSTHIRIEKLRWVNIDVNEIISYLEEKHWPLLIDKNIGIKLAINKQIVTAKEPEGVERFEFSSEKDFLIENKIVPAQKLMCGKVEGIFYLCEQGFKESSIDAFVKNQRIDAYSGDQVDWLRIKDLSSPEGFRSRLKGIIKVEATDEADFISRNPLNKKILILKSDRSSFFEDSPAFKHLCLYLNGSSKNKELNLPNGGILRLINSAWYKKRGVDISKTQELINKISPDLKNVLHKAFEDERLKIKIDNKGQLEKETRKKIEKKSNERPENLMFRCPKCENIIRVKIEIFNEWKKSGLKQKNILQEKFWTCDVCDHLLNPLDDKYKRGPIRGKRIMTIMLEEGMIAHILADRIGRNGPRSVYIPEDSVIKINAEHSLLIYSVKTSDEAFKCNLLDSIIFSIAAKRSKNNNQSFEAVYNELCAKVNKVINIQEYEEALSQLKVEINN